MYRCLILEDESYAAEILMGFIEKIDDLFCIGYTKKIDNALERIVRGEVDILLSDIQMPEKNGIDVLKETKGKCLTILTTAYPEYALEGFEYEAVDYLMKPIAYERFIRAIDKAKKLLENNTSSPPTPPQPIGEEFLRLKGDRKHTYHKVNTKDIYYIESMRNYVKYVTSNGTIVSYTNMAKVTSLLPQEIFVQIHRSYIISIQHIEKVTHESVLIGNTPIPIGITYRKSFFELIHINNPSPQ